MLDKVSSLGYTLLGDYEGTRVFNTGDPNSTTYVKYSFKHEDCGTVFEDNLSRVPRCPACYSNNSQAEDRFRKYIESLGFITEKIQIADGNTKKEIDIYIPSLKIGFEYNGSVWHSSKYNTKQSYHKHKTELCLHEGIKLYHIWDFEDEDILKSKIKYILNKTDGKLYARKLKIKPVSTLEQELFLNNNHLFKHCGSLFSFGLYNNLDELVCLMSFKRQRLYSNNVELVRYCCKKDISIIGGFSKLLKHSISYIKNNFSNINKIITFAYRDNCPEYEDSVYYKCGFKFIKYNNGSLRYYNDNNKKVYPRDKYRKDKLRKLFPETYDEKETEKSILEKNNIHTLYDSGTIKFEMEI